MKRVVIYGMNSEYDRISNMISYERRKLNLEVISIICDEPVHHEHLDGIRIITESELKDEVFDYIVVTDEQRFDHISTMFPNKAIKSKVFSIPGFDFNEYSMLHDAKISIISDDCWGAYAYNYLGLKFHSPFILCAINPNDYFTLLSDLSSFLHSPLKCLQDFPECPMGILESKGKQVVIKFNHHSSFGDAKRKWEQRMQRINLDNIFVKMTLHNQKDALKFSQLPFQKKIGFYSSPSSLKDVLYLEQWGQKSSRTLLAINNNFKSYVLRSFDSGYDNMIRPVNIIRLLLGKNDYQRFS